MIVIDKALPALQQAREKVYEARQAYDFTRWPAEEKLYLASSAAESLPDSERAAKIQQAREEFDSTVKETRRAFYAARAVYARAFKAAYPDLVVLNNWASGE
jgi:hypothetical protein